MRIEKKENSKNKQEKSNVYLIQTIIETFKDYRNFENMEKEDAVTATSTLLNMEDEEVEKILIKYNIYEKKEDNLEEEEDDKKDTKDKNDDDKKNKKDTKKDNDEDKDSNDDKKKKDKDESVKEEIITIKEDIDIPGTEYTLEKGDKIKLIQEQDNYYLCLLGYDIKGYFSDIKEIIDLDLGIGMSENIRLKGKYKLAYSTSTVEDEMMDELINDDSLNNQTRGISIFKAADLAEAKRTALGIIDSGILI